MACAVAIRAASLWDITCDSDGEIGFDPAAPLYLHDVDLDNEEYFLGFFNVGAYQETLGMQHNLFSHPSEATVHIDEDGYRFDNLDEAEDILSGLLEKEPSRLAFQLQMANLQRVSGRPQQAIEDISQQSGPQSHRQ